MADISKCKGTDCPIKEKCRRYTAPSGIRQSWFAEVPLKDGKCDFYWGDNSEAIFSELKDIVNGTKNLTSK
jgi:hypothetical protein